MVRIKNIGPCTEAFTWEVRKKLGLGGGQADVTFTPATGPAGSLDPGDWSAWQSVTVTVNQGSPLGSVANVELLAKVGGSDVMKTPTPEKTVGVPVEAANGFVGDAGGCPGQAIQIPLNITNDGLCEDSFNWRIVKIAGNLGFSTISGSTSTLQPSDSDSTPAQYMIPTGAVPGETATIQLEIKLNGQYMPKDTATICVCCPSLVSVTKDPFKPSADSSWPLMPHDFATSIITIEWDPPECGEVADLQIARPPGEPYHPSDDTIVPLTSDGTQWKYTSFKEPQSEKHPSGVDVTIEVVLNGVVCDSFTIQVLTVFDFFTNFHKEGPGGPVHAPTNDDFWQAYKYIKWKYAAVHSTIGGGFDGEQIRDDLDCVPCGSVCGAACTTGEDVVYSRSAFTGSENRFASIIGHELVHTTQGIGVGDQEGECEAYCWEYLDRFETGIDQDSYLDLVEDDVQTFCEHPPEQCSAE